MSVNDILSSAFREKSGVRFLRQTETCLSSLDRFRQYTVCSRTQRLAEVWANLSQRSRRTRRTRRTGKLLINKDGWTVDGCWRQRVSNRRPKCLRLTGNVERKEEKYTYVVASATRLTIGTAAAALLLLLLVQVGGRVYARRVHCMCLLVQLCAACRWRIASAITDRDGRTGRWHHVQDARTKGKLIYGRALV